MPHARPVGAALALGLLSLTARPSHDPPSGRGPSDARAAFLRSPIVEGPARERGRLQDREEPALLPFAISGARRLGTVPLRALVHDWAAAGEAWRVEALELSSAGRVLWRREYGDRGEASERTAVGDPRFGQLQSDLERLPIPFSRLRRRQRWFAVPQARQLDPQRSAELLAGLEARAAQLDAERPPFVELEGELDLAVLFELPAGPVADAPPARPLQLQADLARTASGQRLRVRTERLVELQPAWPTPGADFAQRFGRLLRGDLHVHGSTSEFPARTNGLGAARGVPDLCGGFTLPELDVLLDAYALDFAALCDGPLPGAVDDLRLAWLGAVERAAEPERGRGRRAVLFDGRLVVAQSPTDTLGSGWTVAAAAELAAAGQLHAVEVWSGDWQGGQGDDVGFWVQLLLAGHRVSAVAGSDTRDEPISSGVNHMWLRGSPLPAESLDGALADALLAGANTLSNDDLLACGLLHDERWIGPGDGAPAGRALELELHHDFRGPVRLQLWTGTVGDEAEVLLHAEELDAGAGVWRRALAARPPDSYLRVYAEALEPGNTAYTNPIWFDAALDAE